MSPVDWWDASARVWRPSVIDRVCEAGETFRDHAQILAPVAEGLEPDPASAVARTVRIADLRPSKLIDETIAQFFATRYTLEMLDSLLPCIDQVAPDEQRQLRKAVDDLLEVNGAGRAAWGRAYLRGATEDHRRGAGVWMEQSVNHDSLPRYLERFSAAPQGLYSAIEQETTANGQISCSPVAMWDEIAHRWRPTIMLNATGVRDPFRAAHESQVLVPGEPVDIALVPGSMLQPIDLAETCFSLLAIPVLARDFLRMHDALAESGLSATALAAHPSIIAFVRMLSGAAEEWRAVYQAGMLGSAPQPRVVPLPHAAWGFTDAAPAWRGEDLRG